MNDLSKLKKLEYRKADILSELEDKETDLMFLNLGKTIYKISQLKKKMNREIKNFTDE